MKAEAIRRIGPDEAEAVAGLLARANAENLDAFPPDVADGYRHDLLDVAARVRSDCTEVYVAVDGDRYLGTVTFLRESGVDRHPWPERGSVLRLLAVAPEARRQGWGRQLTQHCIDLARSAGSEFLALHTAPSMQAARQLYERLGFRRAPDHDFRPGEHYGGRSDSAEAAWGLAYVLRLD